jgi:hypothetical protein
MYLLLGSEVDIRIAYPKVNTFHFKTMRLTLRFSGGPRSRPSAATVFIRFVHMICRKRTSLFLPRIALTYHAHYMLHRTYVPRYDT